MAYLCDGVSLPKTQKALVLRGPRRAEIEEIPVWNIDAFSGRAVDPEDLVLLKIEACGICGSDPRYFAGENPWAQHTLGEFRPNPSNMVLGHEHVGRVVAVRGKHNEHLLGMRTVGLCSRTCGACEMCLNNMAHLCPNTVHVGHAAGWGKMDYFPGAYAEYCPGWGVFCKPLPDSISSAEASTMDILAVCLHMAKRGRIEPGTAVVILGAGPAGNGVAQMARLMGASRIVLTDVSESAVAVGRACGLEVVNVTGKSMGEQGQLLRERLEGTRVSAVFDTVGTSGTMDLSLRLLGPGGTMVLAAVHGGEAPFAQMALGAERTMTTTCNFRLEDFWESLSFLCAGKVDVKPWLSTCRLEEVPGVLSDMVEGRRGDRFKTVVQF